MMKKTSQNIPDLLTQAAQISENFDDLILEANHIAQSIISGSHKRKRMGHGEEFWQYRPSIAGDSLQAIDWRRSARSDSYFIRENEWQTAQTIYLWVNAAASMQFSSAAHNHGNKFHYACVLALAVAIMLEHTGEAFAPLDSIKSPTSTKKNIIELAHHLTKSINTADYASPPAHKGRQKAHIVLISDFLDDWNTLKENVTQLASHSAGGAFIQILDPQEVSFPFQGRMKFHSMRDKLLYETPHAGRLRDIFLHHLKERRDALAKLAEQFGWHFHMTTTDQSITHSLLWFMESLKIRS